MLYRDLWQYNKLDQSDTQGQWANEHQQRCVGINLFLTIKG
ncbi:MAG: hypothetical protein ACON4S_03915 [Porticoccaceae bacterium]